jgi:hypothetical protein
MLIGGELKYAFMQPHLKFWSLGDHYRNLFLALKG